jgi:hypothetical protein
VSIPAQAGITQFERAPSLNDGDEWTTAQADIVATHFESGAVTATPQYALNCAGCTNPICRTILKPVAPYEKLRDVAARAARAAAAPGAEVKGLVPTWPSADDLTRIRALGETPNK